MRKTDIDCHDSKIGGILKMTANIRKFENIMLAPHRPLGNRINNIIHFLSSNKNILAEISKRAMKMLSKIQKDTHCKLLCDVTDTLFLSGSVYYIVTFWQNLLVGWWWDTSLHFPIKKKKKKITNWRLSALNFNIAYQFNVKKSEISLHIHSHG